MRLYADRAGTRLRQLITDLFVVAWVYVWIRLAMKLFDLIEKLAVPGQKLEGAGTGLSGNLNRIGDKIHQVPGVGDSLAAPFGDAAKAAQSLASAGRDQQDAVHEMA